MNKYKEIEREGRGRGRGREREKGRENERDTRERGRESVYFGLVCYIFTELSSYNPHVRLHHLTFTPDTR